MTTKPRTVHPSPPEAIRGRSAYWTGDDFEVREVAGEVTVYVNDLDRPFTVTRDDNFRLVGALVSALAWAEERDSDD